jgi:chemotaxis protein methyltransferase CheR
MSAAEVATLRDDEVHYVRRLVLEHSAIALNAEKGYLVEARLTPLARSLGMASASELVARLRSSPDGELHRRAVDAMATHETSFFRDRKPFDVLREHVLPPLLARRAERRRLDVWSAGCSTGQEPYSIAMLLCEHFPELADWHVSILATDLSAVALDQASTGRFAQLEVNRGLPAQLLLKYFAKEGPDWVARPDLRARVAFRRLNLIEPWGRFPRFDLVFLRNVLIYFDEAAKRSVLARIADVLAPDGTLFLGSAETTLNAEARFRVVRHGGTSCYELAA